MHRQILRSLAVTALAAVPLGAQEIAPGIAVHGFGSWSFADTDYNEYLGGTEKGNSSNSSLSLNLSGALSDRLTVNSQVQFKFSGANGDGDSEAELDFVFAEWKVSDALKFRAGQVKQPFGIYTEFYDVGTVRPFLALPQAIYGLAGIVGEAFRGVGLTGSAPVGGVEIDYDLYAGGLNRFENELPTDLYRVMNGTSPDTLGIEAVEGEVTDRLVGGRLSVLPMQGLKLGGSGYHGETSEPNEPKSTIDAYGVHAEFVNSDWSVRTEWVHLWEDDNDRQTGYYGEVAYRIYGNWQVAGMYDNLRLDLDGPEYEPAISLLRHEEYAVGLNYRFSPNFVVKSSYHIVDGNRFATPNAETLIDRLRAGDPLDTKTRAFLFGAQLSF